MNQTSPSGKHTTTTEPSASSASRAAHTPGPWKLTGSPGTKRPQWEYVYGGDRGLQQIATIMQSTGSASTPDSQEEAEANARLITAAPETAAKLAETAAELERVKGLNRELMAALGNLMNAVNSTPDLTGEVERATRTAFNQARAVLSKASQP